MEKVLRALSIALALLLVLSTSGFAASYTWVGGNGNVASQTDFTNRNNYAAPKPPTGGPTSADIVVINSAGFACNIPAGKTLAGLTMNGTDAVNVTGTLTVGTLTLTNGIVTGNVSVTTVSGGNASSYVNGTVTMSCASGVATLFPIGNVSYSPVTVTSATTGTFTIYSTSMSPANAVDANEVLHRVYNLTTPATNADVVFGYDDADVFGTEATYVTALYSGSQWDVTGASTEDAALNTNTLTGYAFSAATTEWTLGNAAALPIGLTSLNASTLANNNVSLNWSTVTETNNYGFYVERRTETGSFATVSAFIEGAGTSLDQHEYSFVDANVAVGTYYYRLKQMDNDGAVTYSSPIKVNVGVLGVNDSKPLTYALGQNYPNPFNPSTKIAFSLPEQGIVSLKIFNVAGQEVASLVNNATYGAGEYTVSFDASTMASGVYYYHVSVKGVNNTFESFKKMMLVK